MRPLASQIRPSYDYLLTVYSSGYIKLNEHHFELLSCDLNPIFDQLMRPLSKMFRAQVHRWVYYDSLMLYRAGRQPMVEDIQF